MSSRKFVTEMSSEDSDADFEKVIEEIKHKQVLGRTRKCKWGTDRL